ncbi:MAG: hypothetical protein WDA71_12630 [Actinomycetota bacterium]
MGKRTALTETFDIMGTNVGFPARHRVGRSVSLAVLASSAGAAKLLEHPRLRPATLLPGRTLIIASWFEWADTPVGPFSQVTFAIPVLRDSRVSVPGVALLAHTLAGREGKLGFLTHVVACSNEIGAAYSWDIWAEPSFVADFVVEDGPHSVAVQVRGPEGLAVRLEARRLGRTVHDTKGYPLYTYRGERIISDCMQADGNGLMRLLPGGGSVQFGEHPRVAGLARAARGRRSVQSGVFDSGDVAFFGPRMR